MSLECSADPSAKSTQTIITVVVYLASEDSFPVHHDRGPKRELESIGRPIRGIASTWSTWSRATVRALETGIFHLLFDSLCSVGNVGTRGGQPMQRGNPSNQISQMVHTFAVGIAPNAVREAAWNLANQYPSSNYPTIDSIFEDVLNEESSQISTDVFSSQYHPMDELFPDNLRWELLEQPDGPLENESPEESGTRS